METRGVNLRRLALPLVFALAFTLVTVAVWRAFDGPVPLESHGYRTSLPLDDAADLYPGGAVQISGVDVGRIQAVRRSGSDAEVEIELKSRFAPLRSGASVIPRSKSLLGEGYIEIAPGPRDATPLAEDAELAAANTRSAQGLDEALESFSPERRKEYRALFAGLADAFGGASQGLSQTIAGGAATTAGIATVLADIDSQGPKLQQLLGNSTDVLGSLAEREGELSAAVRAGNAVLDTTASRDEQLAQTVRAMPPFLDKLRTAAVAIEAASPDLNAAAKAVEPLGPLLEPALTEVTAAAPEIRRLFDSLTPVIAAGYEGLPAASSIIDASDVGFQGIYPTSRELIPFFQLLAKVRDSVVANFANVGQATNPIFEFPDGSLGHTTGAVITIWNDVIAGWKKKLPTQRPNPYPEPQGHLKFGELGHLQTYDCRHTGNVLYLPPTGTGVPPCVEQGPWKFQGKKSYYPNLKRAKP